MAARFVRDEEAAGSNPATPTNNHRSALWLVIMLLAQARIVRFWERRCPILGADLKAGSARTPEEPFVHERKLN